MAAVLFRRCANTVCCLKLHKRATTKLALRRFAPVLFRSGSSGPIIDSKASSRLLRCVNEEIRLEKNVADNLPPVGKFNIQIKGSLATLMQSYGQEKIQVQLDANSAIEVMQEDAEDDGEPLFVPTFTVIASKPGGMSVQFDCSFDECGSYDEQGSAWEYMHIDSVTVLPDDSTIENVYSVDAENLSEELYSSLLEYLKERGINEKFATDIFHFYIAFEHKRYISDFLVPLKTFIQNK